MMKNNKHLSNKDPQFTGTNFFLVGLIIYSSLVTLLVPLAMYHSAQLASIYGIRKTLKFLFLLFSLSLLFFIPMGFVGALGGIFFLPLIALALWLRVTDKPAFLWVGVLAIPMLIFIGAVLSLQPTQIPEQIPPELMKEIEASLKFTELHTVQRIYYFLLGKGMTLFYPIIFIFLGNIIFLEYGILQIEKFKAAISYMKDNATPRNLEKYHEKALTHFNSLDSTVKVIGTRLIKEPWKLIFQWNRKPSCLLSLPMGPLLFLLEFKESFKKNIFYFKVPFWIQTAVVITFVSCLFLFKDIDTLISSLPALQTSFWGLTTLFLTLPCFVIFLGMGVQGFLVILSSVHSLFLTIGLLTLFILPFPTEIIFHPYAFLCFLCIFALLDSAYGINDLVTIKD